MVTVRPPLWDRAYALAGALAIAGLFLPLALTRAPEPATAPPPPEVIRDPAAWNVVESRPPSTFYGDDGIFLNRGDVESVGTRMNRAWKRRDDIRRRHRESVDPRPQR